MANTFTSRPGTDTQMLVASSVENGKPVVWLVMKKTILADATLDGEPAFVVGLTEAAPNHLNGAWEVGSLICDKWTEAEKMAGRR